MSNRQPRPDAPALGAFLLEIRLGRLTSVKPGLPTAPSRLAPTERMSESARKQQRITKEPWQNWYKLARWSRLRMRVFTRDLFQCQWQGCGRIEANTSMLVAHHTTPHKGNAILFWNEAKIITVCKACHDGPIKALERSTPGGGSKV